MALRAAGLKPSALPPEEPEPDDGTCRKCYEWRRYPPGQEHFGYAWWRTCPDWCECEHHKNEIWRG